MAIPPGHPPAPLAPLVAAHTELPRAAVTDAVAGRIPRAGARLILAAFLRPTTTR